MIKNSFFAAAAALLLSASFAATPASARDWGNVGGWYVTSGNGSCGLYSGERDRFLGGDNGTEIVILKRMDGNIYVQASNAAWAIPRGSEAGTMIQVDGKRYNGAMNVAAFAASSGPGLLAVFDQNFEAQLRGGLRLSIVADGRNLVDVSLKGTSAAFAAIQSCLDDLRSNGGSNPSSAGQTSVAQTSAGFASLGSPPKPKGNPGEWIQISDYPAGNDNVSGTTRFNLVVGTDGRVSVCEITQSSGHASLDEATCKAMARRARFEAATDANGNKTSGTYANKVVWAAQRGER